MSNLRKIIREYKKPIYGIHISSSSDLYSGHNNVSPSISLERGYNDKFQFRLSMNTVGIDLDPHEQGKDIITKNQLTSWYSQFLNSIPLMKAYLRLILQFEEFSENSDKFPFDRCLGVIIGSFKAPIHIQVGYKEPSSFEIEHSPVKTLHKLQTARGYYDENVLRKIGEKPIIIPKKNIEETLKSIDVDPNVPLYLDMEFALSTSSLLKLLHELTFPVERIDEISVGGRRIGSGQKFYSFRECEHFYREHLEREGFDLEYLREHRSTVDGSDDGFSYGTRVGNKETHIVVSEPIVKLVNDKVVFTRDEIQKLVLDVLNAYDVKYNHLKEDLGLS